MSAVFKLLPVVAVAVVIAMNIGTLKKSLNVVGKVQGAATSGVEMQGIAEALARDFVEDKNLPIEDFGGWLKENLNKKGGKETTRDKSKDPWGNDYRLTVDQAKNGFSVLSAGPDRTWKTEDDLNYFYLLTGTEGKNAISAELVKRSNAQLAKLGTSAGASAGTNTSASAVGKRSVPGKAVPLPAPKLSQSKEVTTRKVIEVQTMRAAAGDAQAAYDLANRYITEDGVFKDYDVAKQLLEQAVKNADTQSLREKAQIQLDNLNRVLSK
ncbi:MAG: hypothetical protein RL514_1924 [Verrucomicrobiota bacterium]|jgi:hypothetical protein